ncbi:hypothetical protein AK812_SmicGene44081 [Symbiodinium microadriaticum]|uniref:Uncharacterized protein n=1 Tax=Symbiodinium microadriaticum TaxID=2951 RepID=A0A1Q9BZC9_SYMMI|nr:hypothetical protein AK812_SmicGene44081 [Symbiodinium microadriaticum]
MKLTNYTRRPGCRIESKGALLLLRKYTGLRFQGNVVFHGHLEFTNCYACNVAWKEEKGEGGAFLVEGAYRQRGGTLEELKAAR